MLRMALEKLGVRFIEPEDGLDGVQFPAVETGE